MLVRPSFPNFKSKGFRKGLLILSAVSLFISVIPVHAEVSDWRHSLAQGDQCMEHKQYDLAQKCFHLAVEEVKKDPAHSADDLALCLNKLGNVLEIEDITEEALDAYRKSYKVLTRAHGRESTLLLPDLMLRASILEKDGQFKQAIKTYKHAIEIATNGQGANSLLLADCQHSLGRAYFRADQSHMAEPLYKSSLALVIGQSTLPSSDLLQEIVSDYCELLEKSYAPGKNLPSDVRLELLQDRLIELSQRRGVPESAFEKEVSLRFAREAMAKVSADGDPQHDIASNQSANLPIDSSYTSTSSSSSSSSTATNQALPASEPALPPIAAPKDLTDFAAAEPIADQRVAFYQRMIAVDIKTLGPDHPSVARDLSGLGAVYMAAGQFDPAKTLFMRALKIYEKVYGGDSLLVKRTRTMLELLLQNQMAVERGDTSGSNFIVTVPKIPMALQKLDIAISLNYLAFLCYSLGKVDEAEKIYSWAVADFYATTGQQSFLLAAGLKDYARVLRSLGNISKAELLENDARAIFRQTLSQQALRSYQ